MINKPMWLPILFNSNSYKMGRGYYGCKKTESEGIARGLGLFVAIISEATFITSVFPTYQCHNNFSSTKTLINLLGKVVVTQTKTSYTIYFIAPCNFLSECAILQDEANANFSNFWSKLSNC